MTKPVLVTGPAGTVGGPLLELLSAGGTRVVAGARDGGRISGVIESRTLDLERPGTFDTALPEIGRVFLMRPPALAARHLFPFVEAAVAHGVEHMVFLSVMGVNRALPHRRTEQDLRAYRRELRRSGVPADFVTVRLVINLVTRLGPAARVTDKLGRLLGRPTTTLATYLHDRRDRWTAT